jgi:xanthine dehydrogenase/oxidase
MDNPGGLLFYLNSVRVRIAPGEPQLRPEATLLDYIRDTARLAGTKQGCGEGGCGACTVMLSSSISDDLRELTYIAVNACIYPLMDVDGCHVRTIESLGDTATPHPVQERIAELHATQCGFCTPGMVMSLFNLLHKRAGDPSITELEHVFDGNLCRCTGYRPLLDAAKSFAKGLTELPDGPTAAPTTVQTTTKGVCRRFASANANASRDVEAAVTDAVVQPFAHSLSRAALAELVGRTRPHAISNLVEGLPRTLASGETSVTKWLRPRSIPEVVLAWSEQADAVIVGGETDFAKHHRLTSNTFLSLRCTPELRDIKFGMVGASVDAGFVPLIVVGGAASFDELISAIHSRDAEMLPSARGVLAALADTADRFGSQQVRYGAAVGSHVFSAEILPLLLSVDARVQILDRSPGFGSLPHWRTVSDLVDRGARPCVLVLALSIPMPCIDATGVALFVSSAKLAMRRISAIGRAVVAVSITIAVKNSKIVCTGARVFVSGSAIATLAQRCASAEAALVGACVTEQSCIDAACDALGAALQVKAHDDAAFARTGAASMLYRLCMRLRLWLEKGGSGLVLPVFSRVPPEEASAAADVGKARPHAVSSGAQSWTAPPVPRLSTTLPYVHEPDGTCRSVNDPAASIAPVGEPRRHVSALQQCTGQAVYVDDMDEPRHTLHAFLVRSTEPYAKVVSIDASAALAAPGVHGYFDHRDLAVREKGPVPPDKDRVFAEGVVNCVGQVIGVVCAETPSLAEAAAKLVRVQYEPMRPAFTIDDCIEQNRFFDFSHKIIDGDVDAVLQAADLSMRGEMRVGAQEHFYMEPHALLAVPGEQYGEMTIYSMTQCATKTAKCVAGCLGVPESNVRCIVKRLGGGFGGKETSSIYCSGAIAVAAAKLKRAVRWRMSRQEDMSTTGHSHPFLGRWCVAYDRTGKVHAVDVQLFINGGSTICCTNVVGDRALAHFHNAYQFGAVRMVAKLCYSNIPSNTAFRGFGVPQSALICETMLDQVARELGMLPEAVRERNLSKQGDRTPYGQLISPCHLDRIWHEIHATADVARRRAGVAAFNVAHSWRKRGLAVVPTMYGINFPLRYLNQAGAHVLVYMDGSVLVTHAAVEMGQGIHTKCIQVAAQALGADMRKVHIAETATDRVHNTSPTAASMGSDLNCMAVLNACEQIVERLAPLRKASPLDSFAQTCERAYKAQISLGAYGFYASPNGGAYNWEMDTKDNAQRGDIFNYYVFGAACAEVEVDVLSGLFEVLRADVLMDVGESINPALDIGQVEGAFVQAMGRFTMEEMQWGDSAHPALPPGALGSNGPHSYFIPTAADVPKDMRITLLSDSGNKRAVHSSKAVGEPPFFLASCTFLALKDAIVAARFANGVHTRLQLDSPLTAARIRMACADRFSSGRGEYCAKGSY